MEPLDRRPNPSGWTQPRAPYNPFDPDDRRPPQGYPSEFTTPSRAPGKAPTQYDHMRETMRRLQYVPKPHSELYEGQYKVLRRVQGYAGFNRGVELTAKWLMGGVVVYGVFFHRWNDGQENVFSWAYRLRLHTQYLLTGYLSKQQREDLSEIKQPVNIRLGLGDMESEVDEQYGLERPQRKHVVEAERRMMLEEEQRLREK